MTLLVAFMGALICVAFGWQQFSQETSSNLSYDWVFLSSKGLPLQSDVVVIAMDDASFQELGQSTRDNWDRNLHAALVRRLTADRARVVVFDIVFDTTNVPAADDNLARAIRENGRVVLAARHSETVHRQILKKSVDLPVEPLFGAAAAWGVAAVYEPPGGNGIAREYFGGDEFQPSLVWSAAKVAGLPVTRETGVRPALVINYYGNQRPFQRISYAQVTNQAAGFFKDKCVFIGAHQRVLNPLERKSDVFKTPFSRVGAQEFPGVEIAAFAFLNLLRGDSMVEVSRAVQMCAYLLTGLTFGFGLALLRPWWAAGVAALGIGGCGVVATMLASRHLWLDWLVPAFGQIPLAFAWSIGAHFVRLKFEKDVVSRSLAEATRLVEATRLTAQKPSQLVPDHDLVRLVGKGAYGEVWLARNAVGVFHAVKIVRRAVFPSDVPYEREFRGIQKFMPISRTHAGLVHVLHVGRNDTEKCFYCIMEAADDQTTGQTFDPETYLPKSLGSELKWRGKLGPAEVVRLGLALSNALEHLHQSRLIHRDIKPGNIIYVAGQPKFADIGLVTDLAGDGRDVSFLGTQGYIPPEGPGTTGADVYALGKVLYESAMGRDRELFPEVPTAVYEEPDDSVLRQLQQIIFKACESNPADRYRTAGELNAALSVLAGVAGSRETRVD